MQNIRIEKNDIRLRIKNINTLLRAGRGHEYSSPMVWKRGNKPILSLWARYYSEYTETDTASPEVIGLRWETADGRTGEQDICIIRKRSNLGKGEVFYFICCYTEHPCRTLYFIDGAFRSLYAFPHTYYMQAMSRKERKERFLFEPIPDTRYRKFHYRGKLTPFGEKYNILQDRQEEALSSFLDISPSNTGETKERESIGIY